MAEKSEKFSIIHNLESLDETQRKAYADAAAKYVGLDPALNPFDYIWIPDEVTGFKKLVLYARRGTTDLLREKHKISVLDMIQHDGPGYVSFKAVGMNIEGRKEVAVGAHSTEGLKNERLASAVSTAETRAGRRLTLKFVGLGILDATEVNMEYQLNTTQASEAKPDGAPVVFPPPQQPVTSTTVAPQTPEEFSADQQKLRDDAKAQMMAKPWGNASAAIEIPTPAGPVHIPEAVTLPPSVPNLVPNQPVEPPKRKRRSRKTVDLNLPGQQPAAPISEVLETEKKIDAALGLAPAPPAPVPPQANPVVSPQAFGAQIPIVPPAAPAPPPAPFVGGVPNLGTSVPVLGTDFPGKPTEEQQKQFREKIREITSRLSVAGMMPSENVGGPPAKMRLFAEKMSGKPTAQMTVDDWNDFFSSVEGFLSRNSDKNLVQYVNDVIGVK